MKNIGTKKLLRRCGAALLTLCMIFSSFLWVIPIGASAITEEELEHSHDHYDWWDDYDKEHSAGLEDAKGRFFLGTEALKNPVWTTYGDGGYYAPQTYIYFGKIYNWQSKADEPLLVRVLDKDKDSAGEAGAMFVLNEYATIGATQFASPYSTEKNRNIYTESITLAPNYLYNKVHEDYEVYYKTYFDNIPQPLDYIRPITKSDVKADMQGILGFGDSLSTYIWETDTVDENGNVINSESAEYLKDASFFPLSAKELHDYVATVPYAPGLATKSSYSKSNIGYWLRTGLDNKNNETGDKVGSVNAEGLVTPSDVGTELALRLGFNIETDDISYMYDMGESKYRIAFIEPLYKNTETPFKAKVVDEYKGHITIEYTNAIRDDAKTSYFNVDSENYISVIVKDKNTGEITHYNSVYTVNREYDTNPSVICDTVGTAKFNLPEDFDRETDEIYVFWERKSGLAEDVVYTSNMAKLDCVHEMETPADCQNPATCKHCGEEYGETNPYNHPNTKITEFVYSDTSNIHWNVCPDCNTRVNIEDCVFDVGRCRDRCECGRMLYSNNEHGEQHEFNEHGICTTLYEHHFEIPQIDEYGTSVNVTIEKIGHLMALSRMVNAGELDGYEVDVYIKNDLGFYGVDYYVPIGTEEHPFRGTVTGADKTIRYLKYGGSGKYAGIFGCVESLSVRGIHVEECSFSGAEFTGIIAGGFKGGYEDAKLEFSDLRITKSTATGATEGGVEGILIGKSGMKPTIKEVYTYGLTDVNRNALRFTSNPAEYGMDVQQAACLYEGEGASVEYGEYTAEMYENGAVAYDLGMGQKLGKDTYPTSESYTDASPRVFAIKHCDGKIIGYTNEYVSVHYMEDRVEHRITKFTKFIWDGMYAKAEVYCEACDKTVTVPVEVEHGYNTDQSGRVVSVLCTAKIVLNDGTEHTEENNILALNIEDMIGITPKTVTYDGLGVDPSDFMDNHRLHDEIPGLTEYEVFFVNSDTGERLYQTRTDTQGGIWVTVEIPLYAVDAGVYDLLVVGKRAYEGQEYLYEDVLTITPAEVNIEIGDHIKYYDGSAKFEASYTDDSDLYSEFEVVLSDAPSSEVGEYELDVKVVHSGGANEKNVKYNLSNDKVMGYILPQRHVEIKNISYPTEFVYGTPPTTPDASHFEVSEGATLSFEWFELYEGYRYDEFSYKKLDEKPKNVGQYVLRVRASNTETLVGSYIEVRFDIIPKPLTLSFLDPEGNTVNGFDIYDEDDTIYTFKMGEKLVPVIDGLEYDDTLESAGIVWDVYFQSRERAWGTYYMPYFELDNTFPYYYFDGGYRVCFRAWVASDNDLPTNYERVERWLLVDIELPSTDEPPMPIVGSVDSDRIIEDGEAKPFGLLFTWDDPNEAENTTYSIRINGELLKNYNGDVIYYTDEDEFSQSKKPFDIYEIKTLAENGDYKIEILVGEEVIHTINAKVSVNDASGNSVSEIINMGDYIITSATESKTVTATMTVQREIAMTLKKFDYFISEGDVEFDIENVVMELGKVFSLEHQLVEEECEIYVDTAYENAYVSKIKVVMKDDPSVDVTHLYYLIRRDNDHVHIYDSICDSTCGCDHRRAVKHSGGEATCTSLAVCELCSFEYGSYNPHNHVCDDTHVVPNENDLETHNCVHSCCGGVKETLEHVMLEEATCTEKALCADCGWRYGEIDSDNHTSDEYTYKPDSENSEQHIKTRKCCGEASVEAHSGGEATCSEKAACEHCNAAYGEFDSSNHSGNITYTPAEDGKTHSASCDKCKATWSESHEGGEANCCEKAVCEKCKGSYGELDAHNHTTEDISYAVREDNPSMHDVMHACCGLVIRKEYHSGGEANCTSGKICVYCKEEYGLKDASNHASDEFVYSQNKNDPSAHDKSHKCCGEYVLTEAHSGEDNATCEHGKLCEVCGLEYSEPLEHAYDNACDNTCNLCEKETRPKALHVDADEDYLCDNCGAELERKGLSGAAISGITTISVVVASGIGASIFWFVIKKKSWADLFRFLIG